MTRRDRCYFVGVRAAALKQAEAACAWRVLAVQLRDDFSERDMPKFKELLAAIRAATVAGKRFNTDVETQNS